MLRTLCAVASTVAFAAAVALTIKRWQRGHATPPELGTISHQWIAEQRMRETDIER